MCWYKEEIQPGEGPGGRQVGYGPSPQGGFGNHLQEQVHLRAMAYAWQLSLLCQPSLARAHFLFLCHVLIQHGPHQKPSRN